MLFDPRPGRRGVEAMAGKASELSSRDRERGWYGSNGGFAERELNLSSWT